ncbi:site-specific integrase [candidate division WOR-3 bacterium]|nr:site-specific integrase [candidate division WOR-3 bacterium]
MAERFYPSTSLSPEIEDFIEYMITKRNASPNTIKVYRNVLSLFLRFLSSHFIGLDILNATSIYVEIYKEALELSGRSKETIAVKISILRSFYRYLIETGLTDNNPAECVKRPTIRRPDPYPSILSEEQIKQLFDGWIESSQERLIMKLFYYLGLTASELAGLDAEDFDFSNKEIRVAGKEQNERVVPLSTDVDKTLNKYLNETNIVTGPIFLSEKKTERLHPRQIHRTVKRCISKLSDISGIESSILKHSLAANMIKKGFPSEVFKGQLAYKSELAIGIYTNVLTNDRIVPPFPEPPPEVDEFLAYLRTERRLSENTQWLYRNTLSLFWKFLDEYPEKKKLLDVDRIDIRAFIVMQVRSGNLRKTIENKLTHLRGFYRYMGTERHVFPVIQDRLYLAPYAWEFIGFLRDWVEIDKRVLNIYERDLVIFAGFLRSSVRVRVEFVAESHLRAYNCYLHNHVTDNRLINRRMTIVRRFIDYVKTVNNPDDSFFHKDFYPDTSEMQKFAEALKRKLPQIELERNA